MHIRIEPGTSWDDLLECERHAASYRPCRLHQIHRVPVMSQDWDISMRQKVAQIDDRFVVAGEESGSGDGLAKEEIQVRIRLSRRGIEHIYRGEGFSIDPAIGRHPASLGFRNHAGD